MKKKLLVWALGLAGLVALARAENIHENKLWPMTGIIVLSVESDGIVCLDGKVTFERLAPETRMRFRVDEATMKIPEKLLPEVNASLIKKFVLADGRMVFGKPLGTDHERLKVETDSGIEQIAFADLPKEIQEEFHYDPLWKQHDAEMAANAALVPPLPGDASPRSIESTPSIPLTQPTAPKIPRDILVKITALAGLKWGNDFEMQEYTIKNESEAWLEIQRLPKTDLVASLLRDSVNRFPDSFDMQLYHLRHELEAASRLGITQPAATPSSAPRSAVGIYRDPMHPDRQSGLIPRVSR